MTDTKISALTALTTLADDDVFLVNDISVADALKTKSITAANVTTLIAPPATEALAGKSELATTAEINTGTDATRPMCPDQFAASNFGTVKWSVEVFGAGTTVTTGDGKTYFGPIPASMNGMNIVGVAMLNIVTSSSGLPTVQIARGRQANATSAPVFADILTTKLSVDVGEYHSKDATTPAVIDDTKDDLATGDIFRIDQDISGTGTTGEWICFEARLP